MKKVISSLFVLAFSVIFFASCGGKVSSGYEMVSDLRWKKEAPFTFNFDVTKEQLNTPYLLDITLRHHSAMKYASMPFVVTLTTPSGEQKMEGTMKVRDGVEYVGEAMGDLVDTRFTINEDLQLTEEGKYTISVAHNLADDLANNVIQVGYELLLKEEAK